MTRRLLSLALLASLSLAACSSPAAEISLTTRTPSCEGLIFVGGVNNPGLYPFSSGDSLAGLIAAAGGLKEGAGSLQAELSFGPAGSTQKIDVNRAEPWLLAALPGVGEVTAANIYAYRQDRGAFRSLDDLLMVPGVGPALLTKIAPYVTVGGD